MGLEGRGDLTNLGEQLYFVFMEIAAKEW